MPLTDSILKTELLSPRSICKAATEFSKYLAGIIPDRAQYDPTLAIHFADMLFYHATKIAKSPIVPMSLYGLDGAAANQAIFDFESHIRATAEKNSAFGEAYNKQRASMKLCAEFNSVFPPTYKLPLQKIECPKSIDAVVLVA